MAFLMSGAAIEEKWARNTCWPGTAAILSSVCVITWQQPAMRAQHAH